MSPAPLFHENGDGTRGGEILRGKNWRKHLIYEDGALVGLTLGRMTGEAKKNTLELYRRNGVKFYPDGTWQDGKATPGEMPPIRAEVLAVIKNTPEERKI